MYSLLLVLISLLLLCSCSLPYTDSLKVIGIIADVFCFDQIIALDGANMIKEPFKHSVECCLVQECQDSGYILLNNKASANETTNRYDYDYIMDSASNAKVINWLHTLSPTRNNLTVMLEGNTVNNGKTFSITSITDCTISSCNNVAINNTTTTTTATTSSSSNLFISSWYHIYLYLIILALLF
jgi:hypothetical protein